MCVEAAAGGITRIFSQGGECYDGLAVSIEVELATERAVVARLTLSVGAFCF